VIECCVVLVGAEQLLNNRVGQNVLIVFILSDDRARERESRNCTSKPDYGDVTAVDHESLTNL
jgi:hypothetical protein